MFYVRALAMQEGYVVLRSRVSAAADIDTSNDLAQTIIRIQAAPR